MIQFRIGWSAWSNISFEGYSEWEDWWGSEETEEEVRSALELGGPLIGEGLGLALEYSGFEWWVETREEQNSESN